MEKAVFDITMRFNEPPRQVSPGGWRRVVSAAAKPLEAVRSGNFAELVEMPQIWWQAHFPDGVVSEDAAMPSGLYFLDILCPHPAEVGRLIREEKDLASLGVKIMYVSHDARALRVVAMFLNNKECGTTFVSARQWLAAQLGAADYDSRPMSLTSMCYAPCKADIVYEAEDLLTFSPVAMPTFGEDAVKSDEQSFPAWPPLVQLFVQKSDPRFRGATIFAMLPILGGLATDLRMEFLDGEEHSPSFMSVIIAPQASGKSFARRIWRQLTARLHDEDAVAWEMERKWRESLRDSFKDAKKVEGIDKDPEVVIRLVPSKITEPQFFRRLHNAKGQHLIGFYEELDSLTKEAKGGSYDDKRDLFREAFDNAEHGRDVANVESFSGMEKIFYNFLALGTPASVRRFYSNAEDGLVSRTIFYQLPIDVFDDLPVHEKFTDEEIGMIKNWTDYLIDLRNNFPAMLGSDGKVHLNVQIIDNIARAWRQDASMKAIKSGSQAEGIFLKRASVIAWRACCVLWVLYNLDTSQDTIAKLTENFVWIADNVLAGQCNLFGQEIDRLNFAKKERKKTSLFENLPSVFTADDVVAAQAQLGLKPDRTTIIYRWKLRGLIQKINKNQFKKV